MKTEQRQKFLLILTIAVAALFVGDRLVFTPLTKWWDSREQEIKKLRTQISEGNMMKSRDKIIRARWDNMRTNSLPNNPSLCQEQVLKALQDWAQESGITLSAITPQWKSDEKDYQTLVCRVDASGSLWMLSRFLYDLEKGPMGLKLESVDINARDKTGQLLNLGLQVSALVLNPKTK